VMHRELASGLYPFNPSILRPLRVSSHVGAAMGVSLAVLLGFIHAIRHFRRYRGLDLVTLHARPREFAQRISSSKWGRYFSTSPPPFFSWLCSVSRRWTYTHTCHWRPKLGPCWPGLPTSCRGSRCRCPASTNFLCGPISISAAASLQVLLDRKRAAGSAVSDDADRAEPAVCIRRTRRARRSGGPPHRRRSTTTSSSGRPSHAPSWCPRRARASTR